MLTLEQKVLRTKGIGGSDAPVVAGLSPFKSPYQLYLEKRGEAPTDDEETLQMELGTILEEPVAKLYCRKTGRELRRQPLVFHDDHPFMLANIDRQIINNARGPGIYEGKTTNEFSGRDIASAADVPDHYYIQAQHYMAVYGYEWASFGILIGTSRFVWCDIDRHDGVIAELIRQEREFWDRVQSGDPPPIDGSSRTADLLKRMYPQDTGKVLSIDAPELLDAAQRLVSAKALMKQTETDITKYENMLKSAIGDASEAALDGFGAITWKRAKESVVTALDEDILKRDFPDIYTACLKTETRPGSRRFLLKPTKSKE